RSDMRELRRCRWGLGHHHRAWLAHRHRRDEAVADLGDRFDEAGGLAFLVPERAPDQPDVLGEIGLIDIAPRPQRAEEFVLADDVAGAPHQKHQGVKYFRREGDGLAVAEQAMLGWIELESLELVDAVF